MTADRVRGAATGPIPPAASEPAVRGQQLLASPGFESASDWTSVGVASVIQSSDARTGSGVG